jgi:heme exporter protein D
MDFDMGKYAAYVWPAYAAVAVVFAWMAVDSLARARRWKKKAEDK